MWEYGANFGRIVRVYSGDTGLGHCLDLEMGGSWLIVGFMLKFSDKEEKEDG